MGLFLGIDTSNYTTSVSLTDGETVLENLKFPLPVREGERGLRQSDAVFAHIKNLPLLFEKLGSREIKAVGYSAYPRDAKGSYMPCFLVGEAVASVIAGLLGIPKYPFSHQNGHLMAAIYSSGNWNLRKQEMIAFHVSGGTTEVLHVSPEKHGFQVQKIGGTLDLNAGQAIDRAGVRLGLPFPCGPSLEKLAQGVDIFPKPKVCVRGLECNLSGLENQVEDRMKKEISHADIAAFVLDFVAETLGKLKKAAQSAFPDIPVLFAGGVMSNQRIQKQLAAEDVFFAFPAFSSDNAAGIALLCAESYHEDYGG